MARFSFLQPLLALSTLAALLVACGAGPSKSAALEIIRAGVQEEGTCTLPLEMLSQLKVQHSTKAVCVPKEGSSESKACLAALVAAGVTKPMPATYMAAWPDDVSGASLKDLPAYERRARNLVYTSCAQLGLLRDGRFACADAKADKVLSVITLDDKTVDVRYARAVTPHPTLTAIEAACGPTVHPITETTVSLTRVEKGPWTLATKPAAE